MINSYAIDAELELRKRVRKGNQYTAPAHWREWCTTLFPKYFNKPFASRHIELWEWVESIQPNKKPKAFLAFWGRGGAKSTNAEAIVIRLGVKNVRKYGWYISSTQDKADQHVENIGAMLQTDEFSGYYNKMSRRGVNKYGASKGWRRNRLHTASGFVVDALGLDTGSRGFKIEDARPDFMVIDDVDELHESLPVTLKKERTLTDTILPSGASNCAVLFIQNLIHPDSIASRLVDGRADFLRNRIVSGPFPAIEKLSYQQNSEGLFEITGGTATWEGQSIEICQSQMNDWGLSSFLRESQHEIELSGGLWGHIDFSLLQVNYDDVIQDIVRTEVWVDPAVTSTDNSDCMGISAGGVTKDGLLVGLYWWENITTPEDAIKRAIRKGIEYGSEYVGVETDQGGDAWLSVYKLSAKAVVDELTMQWQDRNPGVPLDEMPSIIVPRFKSDKAGSGHGSKAERNQRMMTDYEKGKVRHCIGTHNHIEKSLRRFPNKPLDLADSWYYVWYHLIGKKKAKLYSSG
jgi:hypothetical protein